MFAPLITLFLASTVVKTLAFPHAFPLESRNDTSSPPVPPTINATISDHDGNDITSSFKVMLYHEPQRVTNSSLTGRGLAGLSRPINGCAGLEAREAQFVSSWCTAEEPGGTMQTYSYQCRVGTSQTDLGRSNIVGVSITQNHRRNGRCSDEEICIDGKGRGKRRGGRMAYCVGKHYFMQSILQSQYAHVEPRMNLEGMEAVALLSQMDGATPVEVDTLYIEAGSSAGNGQVTADGLAVVPGQTKKCRDCFKLDTDVFAPKTDFLKTKASLLTTGAAAGIMWLAVMSG